ncbi:hypothetical protein [Vibrio alginolyticus]|nr:hypothetical protein [Vibrio alginolyticus]
MASLTYQKGNLMLIQGDRKMREIKKDRELGAEDLAINRFPKVF